MTPTRYSLLGLDRIGSDWSFYDCTNKANPSRVGPVYRTKMEALTDLDRYGREWMGESNPQLDAARAMLAALQWATTFAQGSYDTGDADLQNGTFRARLTTCHAAIAAAKAAGIGEK